jgi:hypothetical protein
LHQLVDVAFHLRESLWGESKRPAGEEHATRAKRIRTELVEVDLEGARPDAKCEGQASQQRSGAAKPEAGLAAQSGEDDAGGDEEGGGDADDDREPAVIREPDED